MKVLTFSLGFGPELFGFNDRTARWKVSAIPLGGYVKFFGDDSEPRRVLRCAAGDERGGAQGLLPSQEGRPARGIVAAGPFANFLLAIVIFAALFTFYGKPSQTARVDTVQENSGPATAGFKSGDVVTAIDGVAIDSFTEMQRIVSTKAGTPLVFTGKRGEAVVT